jgi:hypothetical protein
MNMSAQGPAATKPIHSWLRSIRLAYVPGALTPLLEAMLNDLLGHFRRHGHQVQGVPEDATDVILTTAPFGEDVDWREALLLSARRRFELSQTPTVYTVLHASTLGFQSLLEHFEAALAKARPDPADFDFPGLAPQAHRVLFGQGRRGGPILSLTRLVQAQAKSIRVLLLVGDERPRAMYHFDLVGGHPCSEADDLSSFYDDIVFRTATSVCTYEVTEHQVVGQPIAFPLWQRLDTPAAMRIAGQQLGKQDFFTEMVRIDDLVQVPAVGDAVASQYSEGCFSTWDPSLEALVTTVTGSARPLNKDDVTEDDLAVIVGVRPDGRGALVRHVEGKSNAPPSSESVEMMDMDSELPTVRLDSVVGRPAVGPVARSKLHSHRGISAYRPEHVEFVTLAAPYYHYPVSCATNAQAQGIKDAFARSEALQNPEDARSVVFTVLPCHGVVIVEKWLPGKAPFQAIWEGMEAGYLEIENQIPQGPLQYVPGARDRRVLQTP